MNMNTRMRILACLMGLGLLLGAVGPGAVEAGTGKITCDGDGTLVFTGDFVELSLSTKAGAVVHTKPSKGTLTFSSGSALVKYTSGDTTLYVGNGSATAKNVKGIKLTLSGANAHLEAIGTGKLAMRGEGSCTPKSGKTVKWQASKDTTLEVTP
jgi:hypothetical protein